MKTPVKTSYIIRFLICILYILLAITSVDSIGILLICGLLVDFLLSVVVFVDGMVVFVDGMVVFVDGMVGLLII